MKLKLQNFRKYEDTLFTFDDGVTKVSGASGKGKTTLFAAIEWCLYGKLREVGPIKDGKVVSGSTSVTLDMVVQIDEQPVDLRIERKNSRHVALHLGDRQYEDAEAQAYIDRIFGSPELFSMASSLKAESMHPMVSATPAQKRELTGILFPDAAKHALYKEKIAASRKEFETELVRMANLCSRLEGATSALKDQCPWLDTYTPADSIDVESLAIEQKELGSRIASVRKVQMQHSLLKDELASLGNARDVSDEEKELRDIDGRLQDAAVDTKSKEAKVAYLKSQLSQLKVPTNLQEVKDQIALCERVSKAEWLVSTICKPDDVEAHLEASRKRLLEMENLTLEYQESLDAIQHNSRAEGILTCPGCATKLRYSGTSLTEATEGITTQPVKHHIVPRDLRELSTKIASLEREISSLESAYQKYTELKKKYPESEGKPAEYKARLAAQVEQYDAAQRLRGDISILEADNRQYLTPEEHSQLTTRRKELRQILQEVSSVAASRQRLEGRITTLEKEEDLQVDVATLEKKVEELKGRIASAQEVTSRNETYARYKKFQDALTKAKGKSDTLTSQIADCASLCTILDEEYQAYVGDKLCEIEHDICELGKIFFDDTMNISLMPGKESSSGIAKPSFDVVVEYDGIVRHDIRSMSTGEKKRISLILMIVLTKYTDGKMLLLDEAFTSIGMDARGVILNEVSKIGVPVILTSHDEIPGGYDAELDLDNIE